MTNPVKPPSKKSGSNASRTEAGRMRMSQIAQALLQSQSSDNDSIHVSNSNVMAQPRSIQPDSSVAATPKHALKKKSSKSQTLVLPVSSNDGSPLRDTDGQNVEPWNDEDADNVPTTRRRSRSSYFGDEGEEDPPVEQERSIRKRSRSSYEEEDPSPDTNNVEEESPRNDSSFSNSLFSPRTPSHSQIVVPSIISINAIFFCFEECFDYSCSAID